MRMPSVLQMLRVDIGVGANLDYEEKTEAELGQALVDPHDANTVPPPLVPGKACKPPALA